MFLGFLQRKCRVLGGIRVFGMRIGSQSGVLKPHLLNNRSIGFNQSIVLLTNRPFGHLFMGFLNFQ